MRLFKNHEFLVGILFIATLILAKTNIPYMSILPFGGFLFVTFYFFRNLISDKITLRSILSVYFKILYYLTLIFAVFHYPGFEIMAITFMVFAFVALVINLTKSNHEDKKWTPLIYVNIGGAVIYLFAYLVK